MRRLRRQEGLNGIQSPRLVQEEKGCRGQFADGGRGVLRIGGWNGVTGDTSILVPHAPQPLLALLQPHLHPGCSSSISAHLLLPLGLCMCCTLGLECLSSCLQGSLLVRCLLTHPFPDGPSLAIPSPLSLYPALFPSEHLLLPDTLYNRRLKCLLSVSSI